MERAGARLVFIGNGSVAFGRSFRDRLLPGFEVYCDPHRRTYAALGMRSGVIATLGPKSVIAGVRSFLRGHRQTAVRGDAFQQGGLYVLAPGGRVIFEQPNMSAGDRPDLDRALAAVAAEVSGPPPAGTPEAL